MAKRREPKFHYYDWDFNRWFGSSTRAHCKALGGLKAQAAAGVYRELLDYCYKDGSIPSDLGGLAALAGLSVEDFEELWPTFRGKFRRHKKDPMRLVNDEVETRRRAWKAKVKKNSRAGVKSAQKRGAVKDNDGNDLANGRSTVVQRVLNHKSNKVISNKKEEKEALRASSPHVENGTAPVTTDTFDFEQKFREVWAAYPKAGRIKRPEAERQYIEKLSPATEPEAIHGRILTAITGKWQQSRKWAEGYIPALGEFIRLERYDEEPDPVDDRAHDDYEDWTNGNPRETRRNA